MPLELPSELLRFILSSCLAPISRRSDLAGAVPRCVLQSYHLPGGGSMDEDEAAFEAPTHTVMEVPVELVPAIRDMIARREREIDKAHE